jgi:uncharacterized protein (TIRG00374 family)
METGTTMNGLRFIPRNERLRQVLLWTAKAAVSAGVLYLVFTLVRVEDVIDAYSRANGAYLLGAAALVLVNLGLRTLKWHSILKSTKVDATLSESLSSLLFGISLGSLTPGELGELGGRSLRVTEVHKAHVIGLALLDRFQTFVILASAGLTGIVFLFVHSLTLEVLFVAASWAAGFVILFNVNRLSRVINRLIPLRFNRPWMAEIFRAFDLLTMRECLVTIFYTLAFYAVWCIQVFLLLNSFEAVSFIRAITGYSVVLLVKSVLPFSIGDLGIREISSIYVFSLLGVSKVASLNASLLIFVLNVLLPGVAGSFFLPRSRVRKDPSTAGSDRKHV